MAWSREIRLPFLDPKLIELLIPAPAEYKLGKGWSKYILRLAIEPFLPHDIVWRKDKQGFINPESEWLKTALRPHIMTEFFHENARIFSEGLVDRNAMLAKYDIFCRQAPKCGRISSGGIFPPIALEIWFRKFAGFISIN